MLDKSILDRYRFDAEGLAEEFSKNYFSSHERQFPINPFQVLSDLNVPFVFRNLDKLEGAFFPEGEDGILMLKDFFLRRHIPTTSTHKHN